MKLLIGVILLAVVWGCATTRRPGSKTLSVREIQSALRDCTDNMRGYLQTMPELELPDEWNITSEERNKTSEFDVFRSLYSFIKDADRQTKTDISYDLHYGSEGLEAIATSWQKEISERSLVLLYRGEIRMQEGSFLSNRFLILEQEYTIWESQQYRLSWTKKAKVSFYQGGNCDISDTTIDIFSFGGKDKNGKVEIALWQQIKAGGSFDVTNRAKVDAELLEQADVLGYRISDLSIKTGDKGYIVEPTPESPTILDYAFVRVDAVQKVEGIKHLKSDKFSNGTLATLYFAPVSLGKRAFSKEQGVKYTIPTKLFRSEGTGGKYGFLEMSLGGIKQSVEFLPRKDGRWKNAYFPSGEDYYYRGRDRMERMMNKDRNEDKEIVPKVGGGSGKAVPKEPKEETTEGGSTP